ncbi:hypothetical protein EG68_12254 [Paragonimus skrjabini miyazakii]|uniref:BEN domain-containing protein n=1 Tax=Paragonimus skrjabini miyazakii TaxID=59628 RepID=A0A8S9YD20_9TREM|nr:hypothetical protein EG68_12254 [Paragonimus skrjabini miyazakii]
MVGLSSTLSPKRRISSTPFCPTSIVPFFSTPCTSAVIPSPASPLSTPASGTADKFVIIFKPSTTCSVRSSRSMCEICSSNEQGNMTVLRAILEAIHVLEMKVDMFEKILRSKCSVDARLGSGGDELACLPVAAPYRTVQDFDCGELVLMNEQKRKLAVRFLSRFEGDKFAQNFSCTNVRQHGRKLKGSDIMLVIKESIVSNTPLNASIDAVDIFVRKWFNNTRDRSGGLADRKRQHKRRNRAPVNTSPRNAF